MKGHDAIRLSFGTQQSILEQNSENTVKRVINHDPGVTLLQALLPDLRCAEGEEGEGGRLQGQCIESLCIAMRMSTHMSEQAVNTMLSTAATSEPCFLGLLPTPSSGITVAAENNMQAGRLCLLNRETS